MKKIFLYLLMFIQCGYQFWVSKDNLCQASSVDVLQINLSLKSDVII